MKPTTIIEAIPQPLSERTKELRSITPTAFARAFFEANP